jgi:hypothetical protein
MQRIWDLHIALLDYGSENSIAPALWKEYLNWTQSNFTKFRVGLMRETFRTAIRTLDRQKEKMFRTSKNVALSLTAVAEIETILLGILTTACEMELHAGYTERAIALFQALIEFNCFAPRNMFDHALKLQSFESFWSSEAPRIGDVGAEGWALWHARNVSGTAVTTQAPKSIVRDEPEQSVHTHSIVGLSLSESAAFPTVEQVETATYSEFHKRERAAEIAHWKPLRIAYESVSAQSLDEELDRVVLGEDILDYIVRFETHSLQIELVFRFLEMLGVQDLPRQHASGGAVMRNNDIQRSIVGNLFAKLQQFEDEEKAAAGASAQVGAQTYQINEPARRNMIRHVFERSLLAFQGNTALTIAFLKFERTHDKKRAKELAKTLLSAQKNDIRLWNCYAKVERLNGSFSEARKVYNAALAICSELGTKREELFSLNSSFASMEMRLGTDSQSILQILVSAAERAAKPDAKIEPNQALTPTRHVMARSAYEQVLTDTPSRHAVVCFAYFTHLSVGVDAAREVFERFASRLNGYDREKLLVTYCKYLFRFGKISAGPRMLRQVLGAAMSEFPLNTTLLSLFITLETRSQIANRMRRYFDEVCDREHSVALWLFAVKIEEARLGSKNRIRSLFERALSHPV